MATFNWKAVSIDVYAISCMKKYRRIKIFGREQGSKHIIIKSATPVRSSTIMLYEIFVVLLILGIQRLIYLKIYDLSTNAIFHAIIRVVYYVTTFIGLKSGIQYINLSDY